MQRTTIPNLRDEGDWYELGYETGDAAYPLARLRVQPLRDSDDAALTAAPVGTVAPPRLRVALRASLVDAAGAVLKIGDDLLIGPESAPCWQFEGQPFNAAAWLDGEAEKVITAVLHKAKALSEAAANRLLPA